MKKKIEIGDIYELQSENDDLKAYLQCVEIPVDDRNEIELIKVYYSLYTSTPEIKTFQSEDFFFIRFPLKAALRKKIVKKIGYLPLPDNFKIPRYYRTTNFTGDAWQIIDSTTLKRTNINELSEEQKKLSPWGMMNDTLIIELLKKGWNLENWDLENMFTE